MSGTHFSYSHSNHWVIYFHRQGADFTVQIGFDDDMVEGKQKYFSSLATGLLTTSMSITVVYHLENYVNSCGVSS